MAELMRTAEYGQPDADYAISMTFIRKTTVELTALAAAKQIGVGQLYFDITTGNFKFGIDQGTLSATLTLVGPGNAVAITGGTINGTSIGLTAAAAATFTNLSSTGAVVTGNTARAVENTASQAAVTIAPSKQSTYIATPAATITVTLAAPIGDGERRRITFGAATTVTWTPTAPATATAMKTVFVAGETIEVVYNSVAGTPTNSAATTWYPF